MTLVQKIKWLFTPCRICKSKDIEGLIFCACTKGFFEKKWENRVVKRNLTTKE